MTKIKLAVAGATLLLAVIIGAVSKAGAWGGHGGAWGGHGDYHDGYGHEPQAMNSEQQALLNDYNKKASSLVSQLRAKQAEMDALYAQGTPDEAKTQTLAKEIGDFQGRLYQLDSEFRAKIGGRDYGRHHGGRHFHSPELER